jgi:hypothetical protein
MTGGDGTNLFFVHADGLTKNVWSTVTNFQPGDSVSFWDVADNEFSLNWANNLGAFGVTGLTLRDNF